MFLCRGMEEPMKKNITKKAAVFLLSTIVAAQSGLSVQAAALTEGSWEQTSAGWKFLNRDRQPYTGWSVRSARVPAPAAPPCCR